MIERSTENFTDAGEERVAALLGSLPSVSAPANFDMRVRARIAQGRPAVGRSWMPRFAQVAVPAALLVGLGGYFGTGMFRQPAQAPHVNEASIVPSAPVAAAPTVESRPLVETAPAPMPVEIAKNTVKPPAPAANTSAVAQMPKKKSDGEVKPTPVGGSLEDQALTGSKTLTQQRLANMGVRQKGSTVVSAPAGSGFQAGDVIIASTLTSVTVRRDGKTVQIALK